MARALHVQQVTSSGLLTNTSTASCVMHRRHVQDGDAVVGSATVGDVLKEGEHRLLTRPMLLASARRPVILRWCVWEHMVRSAFKPHLYKASRYDGSAMQTSVTVVTARCECERVVLGKGAKVLISESAQGICPPHRGR